MLRNVIAYIWLLALAAVLPLQAYDHLMQSDNAIYNHLTMTSGVADRESIYSQLVEGETKKTDPTPISQAGSAREILAFLNAPRWFSPAYHADETEPSGNPPSSYQPDSALHYQIYPQPLTNSSLGKPLSYASTYRISGWKDSNALYVALNAHFPHHFLTQDCGSKGFLIFI